MGPSRGAVAVKRSHHEAEIERCVLSKETLFDVSMAADVGPPHPACFVRVSHRALDHLAAFSRQTPTALTTHPATIRVHGLLLGSLALPSTSAPLGLADVGAQAILPRCLQDGVRVVALVCH